MPSNRWVMISLENALDHVYDMHVYNGQKENMHVYYCGRSTCLKQVKMNLLAFFSLRTMLITMHQCMCITQKIYLHAPVCDAIGMHE